MNLTYFFDSRSTDGERSFKLGIRHLYIEISVSGLSFVLLITNFGCKVYYVPCVHGCIREILSIFASVLLVYGIPLVYSIPPLFGTPVGVSLLASGFISLKYEI